MITGKTESGFEFELEDEAFDDYELLETLKKVDNGDYGLVTDMVDRLLGEEQKKKLKEHVRDQNGRVKTSIILAEVMEIFKSSKKGKN